ncbi:hypothetical protein IAT40_003066 [Kwoniella sp. CBS 6097]
MTDHSAKTSSSCSSMDDFATGSSLSASVSACSLSGYTSSLHGSTSIAPSESDRTPSISFNGSSVAEETWPDPSSSVEASATCTTAFTFPASASDLESGNLDETYETLDRRFDELLKQACEGDESAIKKLDHLSSCGGKSEYYAEVWGVYKDNVSLQESYCRH